MGYKTNNFNMLYLTDLEFYQEILVFCKQIAARWFRGSGLRHLLRLGYGDKRRLRLAKQNSEHRVQNQELRGTKDIIVLISPSPLLLFSPSGFPKLSLQWDSNPRPAHYE